MSDTPSSQPSEELTKEANSERSAKTRQLLGMKGASSGETSIWKIRLQLMKPITWIPLIWGWFVVRLHRDILVGQWKMC